MSIDALLHELEARLPELDWKISSLGAALSTKSLPRGLFRPRLETSFSICIAEIKEDIQALAAQKIEYSAYYLAQRIRQKINVLVRLCQMQNEKPKSKETVYFGLTMINTRQQWLQTLEKDINLLVEKHEAMTKALEKMNVQGNSLALLSLQAELGEVEKRLTLARETFARGIY